MTAPVIPDAALEADIAILGKKGRGKTYAAKGLVERLLEMGRRVVVLDPLSTWWGLKAGPEGFAIPVLGGPQADLPLTDRDGAALGRHFAHADTAAVLDLGAMRKAELIRFATPFLEELYTANRRPLTLVLEEADVFAPQQPMNEATRLLGEVDRIARRGRQFGFRLISLTQRPAKLNKDVLTQLSTLIVLGITSPQDRDAIGAWVEGNADRAAAKAVVDSLASLKVGEGWVWAPDLDLLERMQFPAIRTPDTSATPIAGEAPIAAQVRADIDLAALQAALAPAEARSKTTRKGVADPEPDAVAAAERRGYAMGHQDGLREGGQRVRTIVLKHLDDVWPGLRAAIAASGAIETATALGEASEQVAQPREPESTPILAARTFIVEPSRSRSAGQLSPTARRILDELERVHPVSMTFKAAAVRAGASPKSSQFRQYRRELVESGQVVVVGDRMRAVRGDRAVEGGDVLKAYMAKLPASRASMLAVLASSREPLTPHEIADRAGVSRTSSGLGEGLRELVAMDLIGRLPDGRYRLNGALRTPSEEE